MSPVKITKVKGGYRVATPNKTHAKHTTLSKAKKQERLLNAIEHGFEPGKQSHKRENTKERRKMIPKSSY